MQLTLFGYLYNYEKRQNIKTTTLKEKCIFYKILVQPCRCAFCVCDK